MQAIKESSILFDGAAAPSTDSRGRPRLQAPCHHRGRGAISTSASLHGTSRVQIAAPLWLAAPSPDDS
jgi:hypothetical protein